LFVTWTCALNARGRPGGVGDGVAVAQLARPAQTIKATARSCILWCGAVLTTVVLSDTAEPSRKKLWTG
jgi:hypothetical protein